MTVMYLFGICCAPKGIYIRYKRIFNLSESFHSFLHTIKLPLLWPGLMYDMAEEMYELIKE